MIDRTRVRYSFFNLECPLERRCPFGIREQCGAHDRQPTRRATTQRRTVIVDSNCVSRLQNSPPEGRQEEGWRGGLSLLIPTPHVAIPLLPFFFSSSASSLTSPTRTPPLRKVLRCKDDPLFLFLSPSVSLFRVSQQQFRHPCSALEGPSRRIITATQELHSGRYQLDATGCIGDCNARSASTG